MFFTKDVTDTQVIIIDECDAVQEAIPLSLAFKLKERLVGYQDSSFRAMSFEDITQYVLGKRKITGQDTGYEMKYDYGRVILNSCSKDIKCAKIPFGVTRVGANVFSHTALKSVDIPASVSTIGDHSFGWCRSLEQVVIPDSVLLIESGAFIECGLRQIKLSANLSALWDSALAKCGSLKAIELPESLLEIGEQCFKFCTSLKKITIPSKIELLPQACFYCCIELEEVNISEGVKVIDKDCFTGCHSLKRVTIPSSVYSISFNAFNEVKANSCVIRCNKGTEAEAFALKNQFKIEYI